jgi:hypothetical protein
LRAVVAREDSVLVLHGVPVRDVGYVVEERHRPDDLLLPKRHIPGTLGVPPVTLPDGRDQFPRHVVRPQGVLETGVLGAGVHMERGPELADSPQALERGRVE